MVGFLSECMAGFVGIRNLGDGTDGDWSRIRRGLASPHSASLTNTTQVGVPVWTAFGSILRSPLGRSTAKTAMESLS
jgi:hypothetical protein